MRKAVLIILCMGLVCWVYVRQQKGAFSVSMIQFPYPYVPAWESEALDLIGSKEVDRAFAQSFYYLGKGARSLAFVSEDSQYVLKFFKNRYVRPHWTVRYLPAITPFEAIRQRKAKKVSYHTVLTGYYHAYQQDREGTGLLFVHLNVTDQQLPAIVLVDQQGRRHEIDLSETRFVLQRKVTPLSELVDADLCDGNRELAKEHIAQVLQLYLSHFDRGIHDVGIGFLQNNGFYRGKAIHYDVGKMKLDTDILDKETQREALMKMGRVLEEWLSKHHPQDTDEILASYHERLLNHLAT